MQQLNKFFQRHSSALLAQLQSTTNVSELVQTAATELDKIIGQKSEFGAGLTQREQRLVTYFFNPIINTLYLLHKTEIKVEISSIEKNVVKVDPNSHTEAITAILASTAGAALAPGIILALVAGLATGGVAVFAANQLRRNNTSSPEVNADVDDAGDNPFRLTLKPEDIQSCLKVAAENFDRLNTEIEEIRTEALQANLSRPLNLEEMPNILPFFHEMLGIQQNSADLPKILQDYLPIIQRILRSYKIDVVQYQAGINDDWFDRQSILGEKIEETIVLKPALAKEDRVLLKGLIMISED